MDGNFQFNGRCPATDRRFPRGTLLPVLQGGGEFKSLRGNRWGAFVQDNWRVNQRLSLNSGVRWDPWLPYQEIKGRVVCFAPGLKSTRYPNAPAGPDLRRRESRQRLS